MGSIDVRATNRKRCHLLVKHGYSGVLKCSRPPAEKAAHRNMKYWLYTYALEHHIQFSTEVSFTNGRCDVLFYDWGLCFEVLHSEELARFNKKNYPLPTIPVPSMMSREDLWRMLKDLDAIHGTGHKYYSEKIQKAIKAGEYKTAKEPMYTDDLIFP